jgi:hypothetical protein
MGDILEQDKRDAIIKKFWDGNEGTIGMIFGAGLFLAAGYAFVHFLPLLGSLMAILAGTMWHMVVIIMLGLLACGLLYVTLIDRSLWKLLMFYYAILIQSGYKAIWETRPIDVLNYIIKEINKRRAAIQKDNEAVGGVVNVIKQTGSDYEREWKNVAGQARMAENKDPELFQDLTAQMGRIQQAATRNNDMLKTIQPLQGEFERGLKALDRMEANAKLDMRIATLEWTTSNAFFGAYGRLRNAMKGADGVDDLKEKTLDYMKEQYGKKMGTVDTWQRELKPIVAASENKDLLFAAEGQAALKSLQGKRFDFDTVTSSVKIPDMIPEKSATVIDAQFTSVQPTTQYAALIKKDK